MTKVGIIGIGKLGNAVALHLLDLDFEVIAYNRTFEKTIDIKNKGATIVKTPKEVAERSELVIMIVKDAKAVEEISFGEKGIIEGIHNNLTVADMSTINPSESKRISKKFFEYGIKKLDIPVMGGPNVAITGNLVMMVSGDNQNYEIYKDVFEKIASKIFFLGESGTAHCIKLAMNLQITMLALALSEGITFVRKSKIDPKIFLEILNSTYFKTGMSEKKAYKMIDGNYNTTFTLANLRKDISTITRTANELEIDLPMISKAEEVYEDAMNEGFSEIDYTGIIEHIKKINKLE